MWVDSGGKNVEIYATYNTSDSHRWDRIAHSYWKASVDTLRFTFKRPRSINKGKNHAFFLERPVYKVRIRDLDGQYWKVLSENAYAVLLSWSKLELFNIALRELGVPIVRRPADTWRTNEPIPDDWGRTPQTAIYKFNDELKRNAVNFLQHMTGYLATYFTESNDATLSTIVKACQCCNALAGRWTCPPPNAPR